MTVTDLRPDLLDQAIKLAIDAHQGQVETGVQRAAGQRPLGGIALRVLSLEGNVRIGQRRVRGQCAGAVAAEPALFAPWHGGGS